MPFSTTRVTDSNGVLVEAAPYPSTLMYAIDDGVKVQGWLRGEQLRPPGHQHWVMWDTFDIASSLLTGGATAFKNCVLDSRISGSTYNTQWRNTEAALNVYDFSQIVGCLDWHTSIGKKMMVRWTPKSYTGSTVYGVPQYLLDNPATYGGTAPNGGVRAVNNGGVGWCPRYDNAAVMVRIKAWMTAAHAAFGTHPAFDGFVLDESAWSVSKTTMPGDLDGPTVLASMQDLATFMATLWKPKNCCFNVNYLDGNTDDTVIAFREFCVSLGLRRSYTDTYPMPETLHRFAQPVYYQQPPMRTDSIVFVDGLSVVSTEAVNANPDQLTRMIRCAQQTYCMGATRTIWTNLGGFGGANWPIILQAIDATA